MSSPNINDPAALQALLERLKSSEAWLKVASPDSAPEVTAASTAGSATTHATADAIPSSRDTVNAQSSMPEVLHDDPQTPHFSREPLITERSSGAPSVALLLSQLQASGTFNTAAGSSRGSSSIFTSHLLPPDPSFAGGSSFPRLDSTVPESVHPPVPQTHRQNLRACTFHQALPHLARLSENPEFVKTLTAMRAEQAELERQLWNERREIQQRHEDRVKAARTKASIIGAGLTQYEADALTDSFRTELLKFDRERVLPAWDGLVTKQQAALEALGVPAMFPSMQVSDRERQQKIMQVLGGIVGHEELSIPDGPPARDG
ncbi:hypothetical protein C8Q80DRAFT_562844 [Daedaleopsis nitida]|nr:hypothetical protein C8Q80DRAFT_562844 [Daedaleopsis nitida]